MKITHNLLRIAGFLLISLGAFSQPPPPPDNPSDSGNNPVGAGAPVGRGIYLLLGLAALYTGHKVYVLRNTSEDEE